MTTEIPAVEGPGFFTTEGDQVRFYRDRDDRRPLFIGYRTVRGAASLSRELPAVIKAGMLGQPGLQNVEDPEIVRRRIAGAGWQIGPGWRTVCQLRLAARYRLAVLMAEARDRSAQAIAETAAGERDPFEEIGA